MCLSKEELNKASNEDLLRSFKRALELETKNSGNGKNPWDISQLEEEILRRLGEETKTNKIGPCYQHSDDGDL